MILSTKIVWKHFSGNITIFHDHRICRVSIWKMRKFHIRDGFIGFSNYIHYFFLKGSRLISFFFLKGGCLTFADTIKKRSLPFSDIENKCHGKGWKKMCRRNTYSRSEIWFTREPIVRSQSSETGYPSGGDTRYNRECYTTHTVFIIAVYDTRACVSDVFRSADIKRAACVCAFTTRIIHTTYLRISRDDRLINIIRFSRVRRRSARRPFRSVRQNREHSPSSRVPSVRHVVESHPRNPQEEIFAHRSQDSRLGSSRSRKERSVTLNNIATYYCRNRSLAWKSQKWVVSV